MKIAVATNDNYTVAGHVGRCRAFLIYQTDGSNIQSKEVRENLFTHHGRKNGRIYRRPAWCGSVHQEEPGLSAGCPGRRTRRQRLC